MQSRAGEELAGQIPQTKEAALDALKRLAAASAPAGIGPTAIGNIKALELIDTLQAIAGVYLSAFSRNARTYPYLVS